MTNKIAALKKTIKDHKEDILAFTIGATISATLLALGYYAGREMVKVELGNLWDNEIANSDPAHTVLLSRDFEWITFEPITK